MLDFRNTNTLWCSILVETLVKLGLERAVICPGSRSTPLTIAFAQNPKVDTIPILDERSAAFFALGQAKQTNLPVALVCSSGTAGANFYPAIIEAQETGIPLIVFTADRPPELRHCHAGQTIDQLKLYGNYPNWFTELAIPASSFEMLFYLRQNIVQGWSKALYPSRGVVHFNCPFREPLAPIPQPNIAYLKEKIKADFFEHLSTTSSQQPLPHLEASALPNFLNLPERGLIIAGLAQVDSPQNYCEQIATLTQKLNYPVLAEALSPLRNYEAINPNLIISYERILGFADWQDSLKPEIIIQIGELPTSKRLRKWLQETNVFRYVLSAKSENFDPLHGKTVHLHCSLSQIANQLKTQDISKTNQAYKQLWQELETKNCADIQQYFQRTEAIVEAKVAWLISQHLPTKTPVFLANSMSVRYAEFFWQLNNSQASIYFNRGANGIDGTLSTALGIAHSSDRPTIMLTGDLALLHDTNGFLAAQHFQGHLTIILINNNGGGIFEILPIAKYNPPFEEYFATPQNLNFEALAQTYNLDYQAISKWQELKDAIKQLPTKGIRILELKTDRQEDARWLKETFWQELKL